MWVYKITNTINNKCYIGITRNIKKRWYSHKLRGRNRNDNHPLYNAMSKYGIDNFKFEILEENIETIDEIVTKERYYIKYYHSHVSENGYNITYGGERHEWDGNPRAKLSMEDVKEIRKLYGECKIGVNEAFKLYSDKVSYHTFEKVWENITWKGICPEVYTLENKQKHFKLTRKPGSLNINAVYTDSEVLEMRKFYVNHSLRETFEKLGYKSSSKQGVRRVVEGTSYTYLPVYKKILKKMVFKW